MYITSNTVYLLIHLMSLVSLYTLENFDLIPDYKFNKTCTPPLVFLETSDMKSVKDMITNNGQLHLFYTGYLELNTSLNLSKASFIYITPRI